MPAQAGIHRGWGPLTMTEQIRSIAWVAHVCYPAYRPDDSLVYFVLEECENT